MLSRRVVVQVLWRPDLDPDVLETERDEQWASILAPLFERAVALGGTVVGWNQRGLLVDFAWDGLYDAIDFLVDAPLAPELAGGISVGNTTRVVDSGRVVLALGEPFREVDLLVQLARPGEVLMTPELFEQAEGRLGTAGEVGARPGRPQLRALLLDPSRPFIGSDASHPPSSRSGFEVVDEPAEEAAPQPRPESFVVQQVESMADHVSGAHDSSSAVFPPEVSTALRKRDAESLTLLAATARQASTHDAADRLEAMAQLAGGKSGEALRRLRRAKEAADSADGSARCRAALALAVALASSGRTYEAALEALEGISHARAGQDVRGEKACARFLSQMAAQFKDEESARAWAALGQ